MPGPLIKIAAAGATIPALLILAAVAGIANQPASAQTYAPSGQAIADIPPDRLVAYQRAADRYHLDWAVIAAIGKIECDHGRLNLPGCKPHGHHQQCWRDRTHAVPRTNLAPRRPYRHRPTTRTRDHEHRRRIRNGWRRRWHRRRVEHRRCHRRRSPLPPRSGRAR